MVVGNVVRVRRRPDDLDARMRQVEHDNTCSTVVELGLHEAVVGDVEDVSAI